MVMRHASCGPWPAHAVRLRAFRLGPARRWARTRSGTVTETRRAGRPLFFGSNAPRTPIWISTVVARAVGDIRESDPYVGVVAYALRRLGRGRPRTAPHRPERSPARACSGLRSNRTYKRTYHDSSRDASGWFSSSHSSHERTLSHPRLGRLGARCTRILRGHPRAATVTYT